MLVRMKRHTEKEKIFERVRDLQAKSSKNHERTNAVICDSPAHHSASRKQEVKERRVRTINKGSSSFRCWVLLLIEFWISPCLLSWPGVLVNHYCT